MKVAVLTECAYADQIIRHIMKDYLPAAVKAKNDLVEILSEVILGTKETRYGPIPPPEHLVVIRDVIRKSVEKGVPIPMLVPFGGIKANKTGEVDLAEVAAIKRLDTLNSCVKQFYKPGLRINVRVEDVNAIYLYGKEYEAVIGLYTESLVDVMRVIASPLWMRPAMESELMNPDQYYDYSELYRVPLEEYILSSDNSQGDLGQGKAYQQLLELGWTGIVPFEQREFYVNRYSNLYPGIERGEALKMLARYFAGSKARYTLNARGNPLEEWYEGIGYIQLNYTQPVPGAPTTLFNNTVYYRTLPASEARTHMPAWRAKGYLKIYEDGSAKVKITNFHDKEVLDNLWSAKVLMEGNGHDVEVQTDYLIA